MKVYAVQSYVPYESTTLLAVFSTQFKAEAYVNILEPDVEMDEKFFITEMELDLVK